jgi:hypothetical protein
MYETHLSDDGSIKYRRKDTDFLWQVPVTFLFGRY